ncbi:NmrA family NAD(P)-binding protein [Nocardia salmonicida]|uniref:NmrA family NAD(P)-binding protein n=1 Tax=Nocardia salmonicida TaxID=53431 RepID=UPI00363D831A
MLKPAFFMDNYFLPSKIAFQFPELPEGKLVTSASPEAVSVMTNADDSGAAVAAVVADPDKFREVEIELADDALTQSEIADTLSKATGREIRLWPFSRRCNAMDRTASSVDSSTPSRCRGDPRPGLSMCRLWRCRAHSPHRAGPLA